MGRKVHPIGFRLGITKTWASRWYANGEQYADQLHEDRAIRDLVMETAPRAGISFVEIERFPNSVHITVHTAKPGIVIGRKGANVKELRRKLQEQTRRIYVFFNNCHAGQAVENARTFKTMLEEAGLG